MFQPSDTEKLAPVISLAPYRRRSDVLARRYQRQIERLLKRDELNLKQVKYLMSLYKAKQKLTCPLTFVG
jgi:hypothetical protein